MTLVLASCAHAPNRRTNSKAEYSQTGWPEPRKARHESEHEVLRVAYPTIEDAEFVDDDEFCMTCHETYTKSFAHNVHRNEKCESCHGPASRHLQTRGKEPGLILTPSKLAPAAASELCLKCHEQNACSPGAQWRISTHAHKGVSCVSCHRSHYNIPVGTPSTTEPGAEVATIIPVEFEALDTSLSQVDEATGKLPSLKGTSRNLAAIAPDTCYRCHKEMTDLQTVAHPHQIGGEHGFNCTTCHDPHGKVLETSRKELCLTCHKGAPTGAWHSSSHNNAGVACTDCHNPHPNSSVQKFVNISHTQVSRPNRLPMSVDDPNVCYKCHTEQYAQNAMPSHHPIKEGKMVCGDCHDGHGQAEGNLKEATVNMVCYKCHAEKQGPFVYEHPPVTEDCGYCHNPHGTVANNLLKKPASFLCLQCHTGHGSHHGFTSGIGTDPTLQQAFFLDCTQCHSQIHGSDLPSPHNPHAFDR